MQHLAGRRWRVVAIDDAHGAVSVPTALNAQIGFTRDGRVLGHDTVNALQGEYEMAGDGYVVRHAGSTLAGYVGVDPIRRRVIAAVNAVFRTAAPGEAQRDVRVQVTFSGDALSLRSGDVQLTFEPVGHQSDFDDSGARTPRTAAPDDS